MPACQILIPPPGFEIGHFDTYFHVFLELNLAYAGIKEFRKVIDERILHLSDAFTKGIPQELDGLTSKITIIAAEESYEKGIKNAIDVIKKRADSRIKKLNAYIETTRNFTQGFKTIFVIGLLYCVGVILISGFQQTLSDEAAKNMLLVLDISFFYNLFLFIRTFTKYSTRIISNFLPAILILLLMVTVYIYLNFCPEAEHVANSISWNVNMWTAIAIASSPYWLHIIKVYITKFVIWLWEKYILLELKRNIKKTSQLISILHGDDDFLDG